jgi:hypothetical protein
MIDAPEWGAALLDRMGERDVRDRLHYLDQTALAIERLLNKARLERSRLMSAACRSETHRRWARAKDDLEHASKEDTRQPSMLRAALPPKRIPWCDQDPE